MLEDLVSEVITLDDDGITDHNHEPLPKNSDEIICLNDSEDDDDDIEVISSSKKRKHSSDNHDEIIEIELESFSNSRIQQVYFHFSFMLIK